MSPSDPILVNYVPGDMTETFVQEVHSFIQEFVDRRQLLPRSFEEVEKLAEHSFVARVEGRLVGFVALEVYSRKLSEIQCLAVDSQFRRLWIAYLWSDEWRRFADSQMWIAFLTFAV